MARLTLFALCFTILSCAQKTEPAKHAESGEGKLQTLKDIRFPFIHDFGNEQPLPHPATAFPASANVLMRIAALATNRDDVYPPHIIMQFRRETRGTHITLHEWALKTMRLTDTTWYDNEGRQVKHKTSGAMSTSSRYTYDTAGFLTNETLSGCVLTRFTFKYLFDSVNRRLLYATFAENDALPTNIAVYTFDTFGYLQTKSSYSYEGGTKDTFLYTRNRKIAEVRSWFTLKEPSKFPGVTLAIFDKYYYEENMLDSVVRTQFYENGRQTRLKAYYDDEGLPVKTESTRVLNVSDTVTIAYWYILRDKATIAK